MVNKNPRLDEFKKKTLQCLATRNEAQRCYPIERADLMTVEDCVICGSKSVSRLTEVYLSSELNFFSTSVCHDCLYTFRSISPSYQWFKKCWAMISTGRLEVFNPEMEEIRKERYEKYYRVLSKYVTDCSVLDVGTGYGTGSKVFQDHGYTVEGVEPEYDRANYAARCLNVRVYNTSIEEFVLHDKEYGLIILSQCVEHLDDPAFIMSHIGKLLEPSRGILYVEVPVIWSLVSWSDALYLTHKSNFAEENIAYLARRNGFEIVEKVWYQDRADEPLDVGLIMRPTAERMLNDPDFGGGNQRRGVEDIRKLYRKNLPLTHPPALDKIIRYSVPYIDHFYYTLRLDKKRVVEPHLGSDFISFDPV